jgi:hypothetical protein
MDNAIKDMTSWNEASSWLAKHGYGIDQIRQQKDLWDAASTKQTADVAKVTAVAAKKVEAVKPVVKSAVSKF